MDPSDFGTALRWVQAAAKAMPMPKHEDGGRGVRRLQLRRRPVLPDPPKGRMNESSSSEYVGQSKASTRSRSKGKSGKSAKGRDIGGSAAKPTATWEDIVPLLPPAPVGSILRPHSATRTLQGGWRFLGSGVAVRGTTSAPAVPPELPPMAFAEAVYNRRKLLTGTQVQPPWEQPARGPSGDSGGTGSGGSFSMGVVPSATPPEGSDRGASAGPPIPGTEPRRSLQPLPPLVPPPIGKSRWPKQVEVQRLLVANPAIRPVPVPNTALASGIRLRLTPTKNKRTVIAEAFELARKVALEGSGTGGSPPGSAPGREMSKTASDFGGEDLVSSLPAIPDARWLGRGPSRRLGSMATANSSGNLDTPTGEDSEGMPTTPKGLLVRKSMAPSAAHSPVPSGSPQPTEPGATPPSRAPAGAPNPPGAPAASPAASGESNGLTSPGPAPDSEEALWASAFSKLSDDGELHKDELARTLEFCGLPTNQAWITEVVSTITKFSALGLQEFLAFCHNYVIRVRKAAAEAFVTFDSDKSGLVDKAELAELLKQFGIEPLRHVLDEVFAELDTDGQGSLDLPEFQHVMDLLWKRDGFTRREYEELMAAYKMFDRDKSGEIDAKELVGALNWLHFNWDKRKAVEIVQEVDVDGSGLLNQREFLMCMRKVREKEINLLKEKIQQTDIDGNGTIESKELESLVKALGYEMPDMQAIVESARDAGLDPDEGALDISELWQLLVVYRMREGLSAADTKEIETGFNHYNKDGDGEISMLDVGKCLRWLGYTLPYEVMQQFIKRIDVDESGRINLHEFQKMVRMIRERQLRLMREAWEDWQDKSNGATLAAIDQVLAMIKKLGFGGSGFLIQLLPDEIIDGGDKHGPCVDAERFMKIAVRYEKVARDNFRINGGFSAAELEHMRMCFKRFDSDGSGDITNRELVFLIEEVFPEMASDKKMRPQLLAIMKEVDQDGNGCLDFSDFVRLMTQVREVQDRERVNKEMAAIADTGFSPQEVADFRDLFLAADDGSGELSLQEVTKMIHMITPLGDKYKSELSEMFHSVTDQQMRVEGHRDEADFPEFLWLMKKLLVTNFANIKERTQSFGSGTYTDR